jgi:hypothetical protein
VHARDDMRLDARIGRPASAGRRTMPLSQRLLPHHRRAFAPVVVGCACASLIAGAAVGASRPRQEPVERYAGPLRTAITARPPARTREASATFRFSASGAGSSAGRFACALDGAPERPCASPHRLTALAPGWHSFKVAALDTIGRPDRRPAIHRWRVAGRRRVTVEGRWYAADSPFNVPIAARPRLAPHQRSRVRALVAGVGPGESWGYAYDYVPTVWIADASTPRRCVHVTFTGRPACGVPIPDEAVPDPGAEGHMTVVTSDGLQEWSFFKAAKGAGGAWSAALVKRTRGLTGSGVTSGATHASGFQDGAALTRPRDFRLHADGGAFDHALKFSSELALRGHVAPAVTHDGDCRDPRRCFPEGTRLQLDPGYPCGELRYRWRQSVCRTLQVYGMFLADQNTGAPTLDAEHRLSAAPYRYPWVGTPVVWGAMPRRLLAHMRVLAPPS